MRKLMMSLLMAGSLLAGGVGVALADDASAPAAASAPDPVTPRGGMDVLQEVDTQNPSTCLAKTGGLGLLAEAEAVSWGQGAGYRDAVRTPRHLKCCRARGFLGC